MGDRSNEAEPLSVTRMPEAAAPGPYVAPSLWLCDTHSHTEERVKSIQDPFICLEAVPQFTLCSPVCVTHIVPCVRGVCVLSWALM